VWLGRIGAVFLVVAVALAGRAGASEPPRDLVRAPPASTQTNASSPQLSETPLAGTEWRLVEIQSMDDAIGTKKPDDPSRYSMRLNPDGTVQMRLDCNNAMGSWSVEPGPERSSGRFEFGPLATTRAICPPPSLDGQIAAQAQHVRSYLLQDGRLYLSLMADGGIWVWEPPGTGTPRPSGE